MNVDPGDYGKEGISFSGMYPHIIQRGVVEYPVSLGRSTIVIDCLVFFCASGNGRIESDITGGFGVDAVPIRGLGTINTGRATSLFASGNRATLFTAAATRTESPVKHAESDLTDGCTTGVNEDMDRYYFRSSTIGMRLIKGRIS